MNDEQYINIEDGLSVGTMKISNKYEIFTEEEVDAINNKIPELDERVGVIEDEIDEINSSLDNCAKKDDLKNLESRMDNFTSLPEQSVTTAGDAELIDGRIGADGVTYNNIGGAIRNQYNNLDIYKEDLYGSFLDVELTFTKEWFYENGNNVQTPASYARTGKYTVASGNIIKLSGLSTRVIAEKTMPTALFVNDANEVISCIYTDENNKIVKTIVPFGATSILINGNSSTTIPMLKIFKKGNLYEDVNKKVMDEIFKNDYFKLLFNNVICIGDSITEGYRTAEIGVIKDKSYPSYLAKLTGWNIENAGKSGITSSGWWREMYPNYDFKNYDMAIINLGQNNGLTDTIQSDVIAHNHNYTNFATTTTGRYGMIIEGIKEQNPNIKIFLVKGQKDITTNSVIEQFAQYYNFPLLNVDDTTYYDLSSRMYHPSGYTVHYSTVGYLTLAKQMLWQINNYLFNNIETIYNEFEIYS